MCKYVYHFGPNVQTVQWKLSSKFWSFKLELSNNFSHIIYIISYFNDFHVL